MNGDWFGARLRELREQAGLSQKALAERAKVSQNAVSNWEQGQREPSWGNVLALAAALGVTSEAFNQKPTDTERRGPGRPPKPGGEGDRPKRGNK